MTGWVKIQTILILYYSFKRHKHFFMYVNVFVRLVIKHTDIYFLFKKNF